MKIRNIFLKLFILSLILSLISSKHETLSKFRKDPDLNMNKLQKKTDKNLRMALVMLKSVRLIMEGLQGYSLPIQEMLSFSNLVIDIVLKAFRSDNLSLITPALIMQKLFYEFRNFAREVITESDYGYYTLFFLYARKELGVISKIIQTKGFNEFTQNSNCTRMRIAQYFMPTFVGNDTSNCSQFDDIIINFSEQRIDPGINFTPLVMKLAILLILLVSIYIAFNRLHQEWETYKSHRNSLHTLSSAELSLKPTRLPEAKMISLNIPEILEESQESSSSPSILQ
ncbi:unnamed protein product [Moneuplotes crassus]|uniref:Transmembrane protein n=1 Tax=Euplotes crassus TaxID=5936 RepID=A0AAD2D0K4_EUPCR|nr:unnamed protein product [Moneuplotes crassus]